MIIATAGHVDHGKTSLLKRLTGVDTDRLPEEKRRGLTIDLGFAYTEALRPDETVGFVDVPGHEKFIRNMLAGVTAIDAALLAVAADDGPMPQTREHLAILDLVGVRTGIAAVTKADLVDAERLDAVVAAVRALLAPTGLAAAPVVPVSSATGAGFDRLIEAIRDIRPRRKPADGGFRMAIDRSFIVGGAGLVVTGLAQSGTLAVGDRLTVSPAAGAAGGRRIAARVRGLKVQDAPARQARAGDRCAVNLAGPGVERAAIGRGQWLVEPALQSVGRRLDIDLRLLEAEERPLRHWTPVHVHAGTADIPGRVALLEQGELAPGARAVAQLVLDRGLCVCRGDAVILRDQSARRTVGGGMVLDCDGPRRGRATPQRLALVKAQRRDSHAEALAAQLETAAGGIDLAAFARNRNIPEAALAGLDVPGMVRAGAAGRQAAILERHLAALADSVRTLLAGQAEGKGGAPGLPVASLPRLLPGRPLAAVVDSALERLMQEGIVERSGERIVMAGRQAALEPRDAKLWSRVEPALMADGRPRTVWEVSEALNLAQAEVARLLKRAQAAGLALQISRTRFLTPAALASLAAAAEAGLAASGRDRFTVADFRDWSGLGRNLSVEMLEYFDRAGFTRRAGNERIVRRPAAAIFRESGRA